MTNITHTLIGEIRVRPLIFLALISFFVVTVLTQSAGAKPVDWAEVEGDQGVLVKPVLGCRTTGDLSFIFNAAEVNRGALAEVAALSGRCTRIPTYSLFMISVNGVDAMQIRTVKYGRLWVAKQARVPNLSRLRLDGALAPEPEAEPEPLYTADQRRQIDEAISERETVPGFAGRAKVGGRSHVPAIRDGRVASDDSSDDTRMKECRCVNGRYIKTNQSCDAACDVHTSIGETGVSDDGYCYFRGELMDCERAGELALEENARRY